MPRRERVPRDVPLPTAVPEVLEPEPARIGTPVRGEQARRFQAGGQPVEDARLEREDLAVPEIRMLELRSEVRGEALQQNVVVGERDLQDHRPVHDVSRVAHCSADPPDAGRERVRHLVRERHRPPIAERHATPDGALDDRLQGRVVELELHERRVRDRVDAATSLTACCVVSRAIRSS